MGWPGTGTRHLPVTLGKRPCLTRLCRLGILLAIKTSVKTDLDGRLFVTPKIEHVSII